MPQWKPYTPYDKSKYEVYDYGTGAWVTQERKKNSYYSKDYRLFD